VAERTFTYLGRKLRDRRVGENTNLPRTGLVWLVQKSAADGRDDREGADPLG
jgi:hypothetical protein